MPQGVTLNIPIFSQLKLRLMGDSLTTLTFAV